MCLSFVAPAGNAFFHCILRGVRPVLLRQLAVRQGVRHDVEDPAEAPFDKAVLRGGVGSVVVNMAPWGCSACLRDEFYIYPALSEWYLLTVAPSFFAAFRFG